MKKLLYIAVITVGSITSAFSQTSYPSGGGSNDAKQGAFEVLDKNHDGVITKDEAKADPTVAASFASADKDSDGKLTKAEFTAYFGG